MAPVLCRFWRGRLAGFNVSIVGCGQTEFDQACLAALDHTMQGGQVLTVLDGMLGAFENLLYRKIGQ